VDSGRVGRVSAGCRMVVHDFRRRLLGPVVLGSARSPLGDGSNQHDSVDSRVGRVVGPTVPRQPVRTELADGHPFYVRGEHPGRIEGLATGSRTTPATVTALSAAIRFRLIRPPVSRHACHRARKDAGRHEERVPVETKRPAIPKASRRTLAVTRWNVPRPLAVGVDHASATVIHREGAFGTGRVLRAHRAAVLGRGPRQLPRCGGRSTCGRHFRVKHDRLVQMKQRYDPGNFFRLNQNIAPA
jgi:berberine-like enzyme